MIEVPLPYADPELSAEVTPGVLTPVYPAHTEYPPDSQPNPQYPPEVYTPPEVYIHEEVLIYSIHQGSNILKYIMTLIIAHVIPILL